MAAPQDESLLLRTIWGGATPGKYKNIYIHTSFAFDWSNTGTSIFIIWWICYFTILSAKAPNFLNFS
jgi:hypothetical protein